MNYTHAGMKLQGEVSSSGGNAYAPPNAHVSDSVNPRMQPTEGMSCGDPSCDMAIGHTRMDAMGMTMPSGVAGSMSAGLNYTHAGMRRSSEVQS